MDEVVPERGAAPVQQTEQAELRGLRTQVIVVQRLVAHAVEAHLVTNKIGLELGVGKGVELGLESGLGIGLG